MKKVKAPRVPVLEKTFEVNLPKLIRAAKYGKSAQVILDDGEVRTVVVLAETRLAVFLGGKPWVVDIVPVQCLHGRVRPLLKCPRAHEGNFQSLYLYGDELACRHCHNLRYRTVLASTSLELKRLSREKLLARLGGKPGSSVPPRRKGAWRSKYCSELERYGLIESAYYVDVAAIIERLARFHIAEEDKNAACLH